MSVIIGSARIDENGKLYGGKAGDQKQARTPDYNGEISLQTFYVHKKGWHILRPIKPKHAVAIAAAMYQACNNPHLGYDQYNRFGVVQYGVNTKIDTECDCSSLVRECVKEGAGKDPGNFDTGSEAGVLEATGLFEKRKKYAVGMKLYEGDVLVTQTKGHTVIVVDGEKRSGNQTKTLKYNGNSTSLVDALNSMHIDSSFSNRKKIAELNGIKGYSGIAGQNLKLLSLLKEGKLKVG